jgi:peroxiredoxin
MTTIADHITAHLEQTAGHLPAEVLAVFDGEQKALDAGGTPAGVAEVGTPLPDGALLDVRGEPTTLAAARAGRAAVVVLYRGEWCPYCNVTLRVYQQDLVPALNEKGVELIAVSPQSPDGSLTMQEKHELTFTVLSDPGNQIAKALGVLTHPSESVRALHAQMGDIVAKGNADGTDGLPMPTVVVVDAAGTIRWIDVHPNYSTRTEVSEILAALSAV